ncbi:MAG: hypothetical protein RLZZ444_1188, partial [Pseudomonadota bacterium]
IHNTTITGCPSYYSNLAPTIAISTPEYQPFFRISVNGSRNVTDHSFDPAAAIQVEGDLLRLAQRHRYDYVLQNETPELAILATGELTDGFFSDLSTLSKRFSLRISPEHYAAFIRAHCKAFYDIEAWSAYIRTKDLSYGSRFHGNLIALLNGVPAVLFVHDSRTEEMAKFMAIPFHKVDAAESHDVRKLYEAADFDRFSSTYAANYQNYIGFLDRNKVAHKLAAVTA